MPESNTTKRRSSKGSSSASTAAVPELFSLVQSESWVKVVQRAADSPKEAEYVVPSAKLTCLHLAVKARKTSNPSARIAAIRSLLQVYPEAAALCDAEGYTPLAHACLVDWDTPKHLEEDSETVRLIVEFYPKSLQVLTPDGYSPLELHIMAFSRLKRKGDTMGIRRLSKKKSSQMSVLKALLTEAGNPIARALDTLFECNSFSVLELVAIEEAKASSQRLRARRQSRSTGSSVHPDNGATINFWVWDWALALLEANHMQRFQEGTHTPPFVLVHAAAHVKDIPLPFLMLAMRVHPNQVREADVNSGNMPLHVVAGWDVSDASTVSRKSMALNALVSEYPQATKVRNKRGKTPMSMALETGTSWDNGVKRLSSYQRDSSFYSTRSVRSLR